jgi:NAD(P)-dependent dehydrogenase (short-subunit alcohol dehydrogenase family)
MRFSGKCVVITGAASGIGRAATLLFSREGATVFAADLNLAGAEAVAREGENIIPVTCDVCDVAQIKALIDHAAGTCGGIDVLFNNAGAAGARGTIEEVDSDGWDFTCNLLLRSVAMGIHYAVPHMKHRKGASIVNTSSIAAIGPGYSPTAYAVAKAGVLHLTKCAAADLAQHGIRVNAIQPGFINTNIFTSALEVPAELVDQAKGIILQTLSNVQPVARPGMPDDIANAVAFLASDAAGFMTGASLVVDGGITIGPRHSWDPEAPGLFDALQPMAEAAGVAPAQ